MTAALRQQIWCELLEIEAVLKARKPTSVPPEAAAAPLPCAAPIERRRHGRVGYPPGRCPRFQAADRSWAVLDVSRAGMRLEVDAACRRLNILRGVIAFVGQPPIAVIGKVLRQGRGEVGVRLLTRIGRQVIDRERRGLGE